MDKWIVNAKQNAKDLAEVIYEQITDEADDLYIDRKWYFEKVVQYMRKKVRIKHELGN